MADADDPGPRAPPLRLAALFAGGWNGLAFAPFQPGVEIHRIYQDASGASAALLRYQPGAAVPRHLHTGYEHVLVLDGAQRDGHGRYAAGDLAVNLPGTVHKVWSDEGCIALLVWERPVRLLE